MVEIDWLQFCLQEACRGRVLVMVYKYLKTGILNERLGDPGRETLLFAATQALGGRHSAESQDILDTKLPLSEGPSRKRRKDSKGKRATVCKL